MEPLPLVAPRPLVGSCHNKGAAGSIPVRAGMRRHPRGDPAFAGVTPTQADVAYQPAATLNRPI